MSVSLRVGRNNYEIGSASFFNCFFSTVFVRLEDEDWGELFPVIMNDLYDGKVSHKKLEEALSELSKIREELREFRPNQVVWDSDDRAAMPPWGDQISESIRSLDDYFWTSDGKNLLDVMETAFNDARLRKRNVYVE